MRSTHFPERKIFDMEKPSKGDAIWSLKPGAEYVLRGDHLEWHDKEQTQPTEDEITAEIKRLEEVQVAQEYARKRKIEYPSIEECIHAILDDDLDALQAKRAEIKTKYPKG
tara:strand:- start:301 stop:633 length:333 start_codon:yes stop_codon:yes gene_type:complete